MRRYLIGVTFVTSLLLSVSARAQVDVIQSFHACTTIDPAPNEVFIFTNTNFGGTCAALSEGFYPNPAPLSPGSFGLPNDSISSAKVGSQVRLRLFADIVYGGNFTLLPGLGFYSTMPPGWDNVTTSIRVENNSRSSTCSDLRAGEFALFRDANFGSDCVVLFYNHGHDYVQPINMGIANDSVSSVNTGPRFPATGTTRLGFTLFRDGNFGSSFISFLSGSSTSETGVPVSFLSSFNDIASSVEIFQRTQSP